MSLDCSASIGVFTGFRLPDQVEVDNDLSESIVGALQRDGLIEIELNEDQKVVLEMAYRASHRFFRLPQEKKSLLVNDGGYSGYVSSGEEMTDGIPDYSEIFTVTRDLPLMDPREWRDLPFQDTCPWPNDDYKGAMQNAMSMMGGINEKLLKLTTLGLHLKPTSLTEFTRDG